MIRLPIVAAIFRKDALDAMRDARIFFSLIVPIALGLLYNGIFPEERLLTVKLGYRAEGTSAILAGIQAQTATPPGALPGGAAPSVELRVREVAGADEARALVAGGTIDVALIVPANTDAAVRQGQAPPILLVGQQPPGTGEAFIRTALERTLSEMAGQRPAATVRVDRVGSGLTSSEAIQGLGSRRYFVLATVVMLIAMIGLLVVPVILTEEMEKKTIDALFLVARQSEVIAAKVLVGLLYVAIGVPLMLGLTRISILDPPTFVAGTLLLSLVLVGLGLLIAGIFRTATQVYTWSSLFVVVAFGPAFVIGLPIPGWVDAAMRVIPTAQGMRLMTNGVAGETLFGDPWLAYVVLGLWAIASFAVLRWQLGRREA